MRDVLVKDVTQVFKANAVHNRSALPPFRFIALAQQLVDALGDFVTTRDAKAARDVGSKLAEQGLGRRSLLALNQALLKLCFRQLENLPDGAPQDPLLVAERALSFNDFALSLVDGAATMEAQTMTRQRDELQQALERMIASREGELRRIILELSTPIMPIADGVIVLPLIGDLDRERAQRLTERLLDAIVSQKARIVIIDITGVPSLDEASAAALLRTAQAAKLLGAQPVLVGIPPHLANLLVKLGVSLEGLITMADLQHGIAYANQYKRKPTQSGAGLPTGSKLL